MKASKMMRLRGINSRNRIKKIFELDTSIADESIFQEIPRETWELDFRRVRLWVIKNLYGIYGGSKCLKKLT